MIHVKPLSIPDVMLFEPKRFNDHRGFFSETFSRRALAAIGFDLEFVQENHSLSSQSGVVRGLHFQAPPHGQDKLVRVTRGRILDVAIDIRKGSPTFGRHVAVELSAENWRQLLVPKGFAHGFCTLEPDCEVVYKVTDYYAPECEGGILWHDPTLEICWPVTPEAAIVSAKDEALPPFEDFVSPFFHEPEMPSMRLVSGGVS